MPSYAIWAIGTPVPEPRARAWRGRIVADRKADPWKRIVRQAAQEAAQGVWFPAPMPVVVELRFWLRRPKSHAPGPPLPIAASRNDVDNLAKAVLDALGPWRKAPPIAWDDDAQVVGLSVWKHYAPADQKTGCEILVESAPCVFPTMPAWA